MSTRAVENVIASAIAYVLQLRAEPRSKTAVKATENRRRELVGAIVELQMVRGQKSDPVPMLLWCPGCNTRHIDAGVFATKPHHTHSCQHCGLTWRPAVIETVGVQFLPGFKDAEPKA